MRRLSILLIVVIQTICSLFFVSDILMTVLGLRVSPISWQAREILELGASIGLVLGMILGWVALARSLIKSRKMEQKLRVASGAFMELMQDHFKTWGLTPAEADVALFSIKGLSLSEIAVLRNTSEGTVKAQSNAIYRKAGVNGRPQLLSLFIDDLVDDALPGLTKDLPKAG